MTGRSVRLNLALDASQAIGQLNMFRSMINGIGTSFIGMGGAIAGIGYALSGISRLAKNFLGDVYESTTNFEQLQKDAQRGLDFTTQELLEFKNAVLETAPQLGLLNTEYIKFATNAGRLGIDKSEIIEFATLVSKTNTATGASTDKITTNFAAVKAIFDYSIPELYKFSAAVNAINDNIGGGFDGIASFVERAGAAGQLVGVTTNELAAMGGVFSRVAIQPERAARAMNSFFTRFSDFQSLSKESQEYLADLGYTLTDLQDAQRNDFGAAMLEFMERLSGMDSQTQLAAAIEIFGRNAADEILTLVAALDDYKEALAIVNDEQYISNKLEREVAINSDTINYKVKTLKSNLEGIYITLGENLIPILKNVLDRVNPILQQINEYLVNNPEVGNWILGVAAAIAVLAPALITLGTTLIVFGLMTKLMAGLFSPFGIFITLVGVLIYYLSQLYDIFGLVSSAFNTVSSKFTDLKTKFTSEDNAISNATSSVINYFPNYSFEGFSQDTANNVLETIRENDDKFWEIINNAGNRIKRSIFGLFNP